MKLSNTLLFERSCFGRILSWKQLKATRHPEPVPRCSFGDMPLKILTMIFNQLHIPDKICLALTCKYTFYFFEATMKTREIGYSQLLTYSRLWEPRYRYMLGLQLQNDRWTYCDWCWKVHPYSWQRKLREALGLPQKACRPIKEIPGYSIPDITASESPSNCEYSIVNYGDIDKTSKEPGMNPEDPQSAAHNFVSLAIQFAQATRKESASFRYVEYLMRTYLQKNQGTGGA